ncbi:MAG TPA: cellulase family glycosylhydrolase [Bdellovibrionales bacterium]|nr:cellulase family glycosylhydrolase [Bdellovibrionales bacterium]
MKTLFLFSLTAFLLGGCLSDSGDTKAPGGGSGPQSTPAPTGAPSPTPAQTPQPTPSPKPHLVTGVNIHLDSTPLVHLMADMGAKWVRIDMNWSIMEPKEGVWDFAPFDLAIANAQAKGLKVFANIGYTPAWHSPNGKESGVPDAEKWKNFVRVAVGRYKDRVRHFGIWNEPNLEQFWTGSAEQYADVILKPACEIIRQIDSGLKIGAPDLAHLYKPTIDVGVFLKAIKNRGADSCIDILTHHVYAEGDLDQRLTGFYFAGVLYKNGLKQWMENAGLWGKRVWITEFGQNIDGSTEENQARWLVENLRVLARTPWIDLAFIFEMTDDPRPDAPYHMGLTRADGSKRPAYFEVKNAIEKNFAP